MSSCLRVMLPLVSWLPVLQGTASPCSWTAQPDVTFDLSPLHKLGHYRVSDASDLPSRNYTYAFNICGNIQPETQQPLQDELPSCTIGEQAGPAYQISNMHDACWRLGDDASDVVWALADQRVPTYGVKLTYSNGDSCGWKRRQLTVNLVCDDDYKNIPDAFEEHVIETTECEYEMTLRSAWGCPSECRAGHNHHLCSGHGICGFNTELGGASCYCHPGYTGSTCQHDLLDPCGAGTVFNAKSKLCERERADPVQVATLAAVAVVISMLTYFWLAAHRAWKRWLQHQRPYSQLAEATKGMPSQAEASETEML